MDTKRSRIPLSQIPPRTPAVEAARNLKRKSIDVLNSAAKRANTATRIEPTARLTATRVTDATPKVSAKRPLPSSYTVGRATVASTRPPVGRPSNARPNVTGRAPSPAITVRPKIKTDKEKNVDLQKENTRLKETIEEVRATALAQTQLCQDVLKEKTFLQAQKELLEEQNARLNQENASIIGDRERLRGLVIEADTNIRDLHNKVIDLKGQIRVVIRTRDLSGESSQSSHITYPDRQTIMVSNGVKDTTCTVQSVFTHAASQLRVFNDGVKELILSTIHGYNVTIVAYGQTGSGKTFTMRGGMGEMAGIIPRAVIYLLTQINTLKDLGWKFELSASFLEIYNNEVYDLLVKGKPKLTVNMQNDVVNVVNLSMHEITDEHMVSSLLSRADKHRSTAATKCNEQSSRSHAVFGLVVKGINEITGESTRSVLNLVDLAGSERSKESGATGERLVEANNINKALSNFKMCIRALLCKEAHVPYRSNKLTMVLSDSLGGGKSKTMVIVTLNPSANPVSVAETKRSVEFAQELSKTTIGVAQKQSSTQ